MRRHEEERRRREEEMMRHREQEDMRQRQPEGFKPNYLDNVSTAGRQHAHTTFLLHQQTYFSRINTSDEENK